MNQACPSKTSTTVPGSSSLHDCQCLPGCCSLEFVSLFPCRFSHEELLSASLLSCQGLTHKNELPWDQDTAALAQGHWQHALSVLSASLKRFKEKVPIPPPPSLPPLSPPPPRARALSLSLALSLCASLPPSLACSLSRSLINECVWARVQDTANFVKQAKWHHP